MVNQLKIVVYIGKKKLTKLHIPMKKKKNLDPLHWKEQSFLNIDY
jgi:hypothetical protein